MFKTVPEEPFSFSSDMLKAVEWKKNWVSVTTIHEGIKIAGQTTNPKSGKKQVTEGRNRMQTLASLGQRFLNVI